MALNSSGPISLIGSITGQSIAKELEVSETTQLSLFDSSVRNLLGVASGTISMFDGYGKSSTDKLVGTLQTLISPISDAPAPQQGASVFLSENGSTLVMGAPRYDLGSGTTGATLVYVYSNNAWSQQATLVSGDYIKPPFVSAGQGVSVSLSSDGNTLASGASGDNNFVGATFIFTRSGSSWSQQAKLVGTGNIGGGEQGLSVSLSNDGNTLAVGGYGDNGAIGAVWIFTRSGSSWSQQAKLTPTGYLGSSPSFGFSVSLSGDGNTVAIGAKSDNFSGNGAPGATFIFTRSGSSWSQQAKLIGTGIIDGGYGNVASQGVSVSLNYDGSILAVGGDLDNYNGSNAQGATWIFTKSAGVWSQQTKLIGTGSVGNAFQGRYVSLSSTGNLLCVGGNTDDSLKGATWLFTKSGSSWSQKGSKLTPTGYSTTVPRFGVVGLSRNGNVLAVGGPYDRNQIGSVWIFV